MKEQSNELFFVQVKEPTEVRRNILESLKEIVELLQGFEKFKQVRHEKLENIHKLRDLLKEANKMLGNLKTKLPQTSLKASVTRETTAHPKKVHHKKKETAKEKAPKKEMTEFEKLESELNAIESELKSLS